MSRRSSVVVLTAAVSCAWAAVMFVQVHARSGGSRYDGGRQWERRHPGPRHVQLTPLEELGKLVFFDKISRPATMSCATCHDPEVGGTNPDSNVNLHQVAITGANPHTIGSLRPQTNTYASMIEPFHPCNLGGLPTPPFFSQQNYCGGNFWNGRAEGRDDSAIFPLGATKHVGQEIFYTTAGNPLPLSPAIIAAYREYFGPTADQAINPMPNPVEQNMPRLDVCRHVKYSQYAGLYRQVWGVEINCSDAPVTVNASDVPPERAFDISFKRLMLAVCAWQDSEDNNSFSSKRDKALDDDADGQFPLDGLTAEENLGHDLFYNTLPINPFVPEAPIGPPANRRPFASLPITNCSFCHSSDDRTRTPGFAPGVLGTDELERYADDSWHTIGTPRNPEIPPSYNALGQLIDTDLGFEGHAGLPYSPGFFHIPTLRNVDKRPYKGFVKAYTHNGWFKSLESLVHFYNTSAVANPAAAPADLATANSFGITKCAAQYQTEKQALAHNCWPAPAYPGASTVLVGNLHLTLAQEKAIVAYLRTLSDQHTAQVPALLEDHGRGHDHDRDDRR